MRRSPHPALSLLTVLFACSPNEPNNPSTADLTRARDVVVQFTAAIGKGDQEAARALLVDEERKDPRRQFAREGLGEGYEVGQPTAKEGAAHVTVSPKGGGKPVTFVLLPQSEGWRVSLSASMHQTMGRDFAALNKMLEDTGRQMAERFAASQGQPSNGPTIVTPPSPPTGR